MLLQQLLEVAGACLDFVEKAYVLDRDHRLIREGRDEVDLPLIEGPDLAASERHDADRLAVAHQRDPEQGAISAGPFRFVPGVIRVPLDILDLDDLAFQQGSARDVSFLRSDGNRPDVFTELVREAVQRLTEERAVALTRDGADIGVAQSCCGLDERIEHRLQVEGRAADDLQHLGRRRLLLQRLGELGGARLDLLEQARILDRDDGLVCEGG